jgi:hypothetical protein
MGLAGSAPRPNVVRLAAGNMESLAGVTAEQMADELIANHAGWGFDAAAPGMATTPLLVMTSDDGLATHSERLVNLARAQGNQGVTVIHMNTDHGWSDHRIALQSEVINWLQSLAP